MQTRLASETPFSEADSRAIWYDTCISWPSGALWRNEKNSFLQAEYIAVACRLLRLCMAFPLTHAVNLISFLAFLLVDKIVMSWRLRSLFEFSRHFVFSSDKPLICE